MRYSLYFTRTAQKEMDALEFSTFRRIDSKVMPLAKNPRPSGCKKLQGFSDQWRIRIGNYRIIYIIDDSKSTVTITRIAHRSEVYEP